MTTLTQQVNYQILLLSKHLFWDTPLENINPERSKKFIIQRVLEYGLMKDWLLIVEWYGLEEIVNNAKTFRTMSPIDLNFIATISNTPKEEFRCYNLRLSTGKHWIY